MNRKNFVKLAGLGMAGAAAGGLTACKDKPTTNSAPALVTGTRAEKAVHVLNGKNRFQEELMIWGVIPLQIKVSGKDTAGAFFSFEHAKTGKGGPPRHFHYEQDEWFYAMEGEFAI